MNVEGVNYSYIISVVDNFTLNLNSNTTKKIETQLVLEWLQNSHNPIDREIAAEKILISYPKLNHATNTKRYNPITVSKTETLARIIFERGFKQNPESLINALEQDPSNNKKPFYSKLNKATLIKLLKGGAYISNHTLFRSVVAISTIALSCWIGYQAYESLSQFIVTRGIPFVINHTPLAVVRACNLILDTTDWLLNYKYEILLVSFIAQRIILALPPIPRITETARNISFMSIFKFFWNGPQTLFWFLLDSGIGISRFATSSCTQFSNSLNSVARTYQQKRVNEYYPKVYEAWKVAVSNLWQEDIVTSH